MALPNWIASRQTLAEHPAAYCVARSTRAYRAKCRSTSHQARQASLRAAILWLCAALARKADLPSADVPGLEEVLDLYRLEWAQQGGQPIGRSGHRKAGGAA